MATNFPAALDAATNLYTAVNSLQTTVATFYTAADTSLVLADATGFPATGGIVYVAGERGVYTGKTGNTLTGVTGLGNNHNAGEDVRQEFDAAMYNNLRDAVLALEAALGIAGSADANSLDYIAKHKPNLASANPAALGSAAPGTGATAARDDHVHPTTGLELIANKVTDLSSNDNTHYPTTAAVLAAINALLGASDAMVYKGATDCSGNPNYPAADAGYTYRVSVAGKIGGASGKAVEVGDWFVCNTDATSSGNEASVGTKWNVIQTNLDGAVIGPASATDGRIVLFDGATGKLIKDGGILLAALATLSGAEDLYNKTLITPWIHNVAGTYHYKMVVSALAADRNITLPLLAGDDVFVFADFIQTLNNKRINNRVSTATSTATLTVDSDAADMAELTAQAADLTIANPTGTPANGQGLLVKITDNGTQRNIAYGTQFRACGGAKTTATTLNKTIYIPCIWDSTDSKWDTFPAQVEV